MSELEAEQWLDYAGEPRPCYPKSEADKVIVRHKYKRCLAMARWCMARYNEWAAYYPTTTTRKMKFLDKWEKRWRELAKEPTWEKFLQLIHKEAK